MKDQNQFDLILARKKLNKHQYDPADFAGLLKDSDKAWQNKKYWKLPEALRHAIDVA